MTCRKVTSTTDPIKFLALNCSGYKANCTYIDSLTQTYDCLFLNELWITKAEEHLLNHYKKEFRTIFQPARKHHTGRPFGGTALLLRKRTFQNTINIMQEDFLTTVKTSINNMQILISGVYLQSISSNTDHTDIYRSQLATLTGITEQFSDSCETIILGDFQSYPIIQNTTRIAQQNKLSKHLTEFMEENELNPIDITKGEGPTYTYQHISLPNRSYIDHILTSNELSKKTCHTKVIEPSASNISDHLPVTTTIELKKSEQIESIKQDEPNEYPQLPNFIWYNKRFISIYQNRIDSAIKQLTLNANDIETDISKLNETLRQCASDSFAQLNNNHFNFKPKKWWSNDLTLSRNKLHQMFNLWRDQGFPRSQDNIAFQRYLFARKQFRNMVKRAKNQANVDHYINVDKLKNLDARSYWKNIKINKNSAQKLFTINGKTTNPEIRTEFKKHFENLLNIPRTPNIDNAKSKARLGELLSTLEASNSTDFYVSECDVKQAIDSLSRNKTRDPFNLRAEHFIHASGDTFIQYITELINNLFQAQTLPPALCTSLIIPLVKNYKKPLSDPNNYRGISIIPIITKIAELVIIAKCPGLKNNNSSQFGFVTGSSTVHAEILIQDTINYYNKNDSPMYICSLDAEKAFDCCNWQKLFEKLSTKDDIPSAILKFLIKLYLNSEAAIIYNGHKTKTFNFSQGVRQGSLISPYLYNIYTEDLLETIKGMKIGATLGNSLNTSIIAYADDLILLSPTLRSLQEMINKCIEYGQEHGLKFNHAKTQFCVSGPCQLPAPALSMYNIQILPKQELVHLGFKWKIQRNTLQLNHHKDVRISELWAVTSSLITAGIRNTHPNTIVHIFNTIVVPKLLYGLEIVRLSNSDITQLEAQARSSLKALLGVSKHSRNLINQIYKIPDISSLIQKRAMLIPHQVLKGNMLRRYLLHLATKNSTERAYSSLNEVISLYVSNGLSIVASLLGNKPKTQKETHIENLEDPEIASCKNHIENWHIYEHRIAFKSLLEARIQR